MSIWDIKTNSKTSDTERMMDEFHKLYQNNTTLNFGSETLSHVELVSFTRGKYKDMLYKFELNSLVLRRESEKFWRGESEYSEQYFVNIIHNILPKEKLRNQLKIIKRMLFMLDAQFEPWRVVKYTEYGDI